MKASSPIVASIALAIPVACGLAASCVASGEPVTGDDAELKATTLLDLAPELAFEGQATGFVGGEQLDLYSLNLDKGDQFKVVETVLDGDLEPDFTLFMNGKVSSESFDVDDTSLTKIYSAPTSGRALLAVHAHNKVSAGGYAISLSCSGGPCKGEPAQPLDAVHAAECMHEARECAFARMGAFHGLVGPARSRSMFEECLAEADVAGTSSCASACQGDEATEICGALIALIPFYADQSADCLEKLDRCVDACEADPLPIDGKEIGLQPESLCLVTGLSGTCDQYARGHAECGGTYADDSRDECVAFCEATIGAWTGDLDNVCQEKCP